jgi:hypothetical protein
VEEAPAAPAAAPVPPAPQGAVQSMAETLPAALEPELRRIIDTAVARVAAIELEAIHEARELTQRSEKEAREALRFALDRAFNLIATLELLASTVSGMADALKIELDDAIDALRKVPEPESELAKELAARAPGPAQEALVVEPQPEPEPVPTPEPAPAEAEAQVTAEQPAAVVEEPAPVEEPISVAEPAPAEVASAAARGNGYPPAERQAESLAAAAGEPEPEPEPEPAERTVMRVAPSPDAGMVPTRRRGLMRRLFAK